ncbi:RagB/SusD family nutrient uptake outer membrane protein, partial [Prevotella sp.]
ANYTLTSDNTHGRLICDFVLGGNCSRGVDANSKRTSNYSPTGFLNKKFINPDLTKSKTGADYTNTPWPLIRLAELYLGYAECLVETNHLDEACTYLNKVRTRAGLPGVKEAWEQFGKEPAKATTKEGLRDIVRNERMNEFYLENQNFWDMRRWLLAEKYFNVKVKGLNIDAENINDFGEVQEVVFERKFQSPMNYLMPIPSADINRNDHVVQTPGY